MNLSGAVVLVADGSSAIGVATAAAFAAAGARVAAGCDRRDDVASAALGDFWIVDGDGEPAERCVEMVRRTAEHFGTVDVLINGLVCGCAVRSDQLRAEDVRAATEANLIGPIAASREALRGMRRQGRGHIVNLTDPAYMLGAPLRAAYAASVAARSSWTRALQAELEETEIRVTEYFIGAITSGADEVGDGFAVADARQGRVARFLATIESPEDIANQLVACVRRPRATAYPSAAVRAAAALGLFSRLRVRFGAGAARAWRSRHGAPVFTPATKPIAQTGEDVVAAPAPTALEAAAGREVAPAPTAPEAAAGGHVAPVVRSAAPPAATVATEAPRKAAAKKGSPPRGAAKRASAAKQAAGKSPVAAAPKQGPRGKKVAPLSPVATARVRAAAERAAASARVKAKPASPPKGEDEES